LTTLLTGRGCVSSPETPVSRVYYTWCDLRSHLDRLSSLTYIEFEPGPGCCPGILPRTSIYWAEEAQYDLESATAASALHHPELIPNGSLGSDARSFDAREDVTEPDCSQELIQSVHGSYCGDRKSIDYEIWNRC